MPVRVALLDWRLVNAFAVPGGQVILTRGLVETAGSPDEVAGVLAHELGHAIELHPETGLVRAMGMLAAAQLIFAGSSGTVSNVGVVLTQLRYTRIAEREADVHALRMLKGAGISPKGFGDFFERLEGSARRPKRARRHRPSLELISTHPPSVERIAMVRAQPAYPATPALSAEDWKALREACAALRRPRPPGPPPPDREIAEATQDAGEQPQRRGGAAEARPRLCQEASARAGARRLQQGRAAEAGRRHAALPPRPGVSEPARHEDALREYSEVIRLAPNQRAPATAAATPTVPSSATKLRSTTSTTS